MFVTIVITLTSLCMAHVVTGAETYIGEKMFVGCYRYFRGLLYTAYTLETCIKMCVDDAFFFAAIKVISRNKTECYCGHALLFDRVPTDECREYDHYAAYTVMPPYLGCFKDMASRDLPFLATNSKTGDRLTNEMCIAICQAKNYRYAATQYSWACFCGNSFGKYGRSTGCKMTCAGDASHICGGPYANSVYGANHIPGLMMYSSDLFNCVSDWDRHNFCTQGPCKKGWKGSRCHLRDCSYDNGRCEDQKCVQVKINGQYITECVCDEGCRSTSIYEKCQDFDDCRRNVCASNQICINLFGSYLCQASSKP